MDRVRVLDKSGTVLHVLESGGSSVSVGRDRKKCGVALPVNAQGVSRIHGSFTWDKEGTLTYSDASTYGTIVDGKLVKGGSERVKDGSHVLVGDIELKIEFSRSSSASVPSNDCLKKKGSNFKRKCIVNDSLTDKPKRSKTDAKASLSQQRQSQVKTSQFMEDDDCVILAEDTPQIQNVDSKAKCTQNIVSFVSDSATVPSCNSSASNNADVGSSIDSKSQPFSSAPVQRRKKQCIFDINRRPVQQQPSSLVLVEDTQLERFGRVAKDSKKEMTKDVSTVFIAETCDQSAHSPQLKEVEMTVSAAASLDSSLHAPGIPHDDVSVLPSKSVLKRDSSRNPIGLLAPKKARIFDALPSKSNTIHEATDTGSQDENAKHPNMYDILKLVSSGKHYDNFVSVEDTADEGGLEIERVVATLNDLICYADIERPPKRRDVPASVHNESGHKTVNFKRFKKASQGRFNASLSSANLSCMIAGNDDLVDFRQLS